MRPLSLRQTSYRLRAGDRTRIDAEPETLDFLRAAKTRAVTVRGSPGSGFAVAPDMDGNDVILAASLTMQAGEYAVTLAAVDESGDERKAIANITVEALAAVPTGGTTPPVVLLNGWQAPSLQQLSTCPIDPKGAKGTFGSLDLQLAAPAVYFFDNCVEQSVNGSSIEELGLTLGQFLNMIQYAGGGLVPQVDLVGHSMGGLIVRAYLSGLQGNGSLAPVLNPRVRKFIEIATPNFGSFLARITPTCWPAEHRRPKWCREARSYGALRPGTNTVTTWEASMRWLSSATPATGNTLSSEQNPQILVTASSR